MEDEKIQPIMQSALKQLQLQLQANIGPKYYLSQWAVGILRRTLYDELKSYDEPKND